MGSRSLKALLCASAVFSGCTTGGHHGPDPLADAGPNNDASIPPHHDAGDVGPDAGPHDGLDILALTIQPADPVLDCVGGSSTQAFQAIATMTDGSMRNATGAWSIDSSHLGAIATDGTFRGRDGCVSSGVAHVSVELTNAAGFLLRASTSITVRVTHAAPNVDVVDGDDPASHFASALGSGAAPRVLYPLDGTVMPNNVLPADIQWDSGAMNDLYRVTLSNSTLTITTYVRNTGAGHFRYDWTPDTDTWRLVAENYSTEPLNVQVDRWVSADDSVLTGTPIAMKLTRASIAGHVYYWDVGASLSAQGKILRINAFTGTRDVVVNSTTCMGCHSISPDGRYMGVMIGGGDPSARATVYDLSTDLTIASPPSVFPVSSSNVRWASATWSPDGTRMMYSDSQLHLIDPMTGAGVPTTLPTDNYYGLAWAPNGSAIAMGSMLEGETWFDRYSRGDLVVMPVTGADTFGSVSRLHTGADLSGAPEGGTADSHPTWSPDSNLLVFQHGNHDRSDLAAENVTTWSSAALYAMKPDGTSVVRLDNLDANSSNRDFWPTFSPFVSNDGAEFSNYYWVAFTSGRPYGNAQAGTASNARRQVWVAAIRADADSSTDPSSVPYWLPGQDVSGQNMAAQWAPVACIAADDSCTTSSECCSGNCAPSASGDYTCQSPAPEMCHARGETCSTDSDCCPATGGLSLICQGNTCVPFG